MKNQKNVVITQRIIPELVSGSSTQAVTKQQALKTLKKFQGLSYFTTTHGFPSSFHNVVMRELGKEGAKQATLLGNPPSALCATSPTQGGKIKNHGFTLIELLVVVLIIGILAAVAVPQYQVAVVKARIGAILPLMASLQSAQEIYYLENGQYTGNASELNVEVPGGCVPIENNIEYPTGSESVYACNKDLVLSIKDNGKVNLNYCPGDAQNYADCLANRTVHVTFVSQFGDGPTRVGKRLCLVYNGSKLGKAVCSSLGLARS